MRTKKRQIGLLLEGDRAFFIHALRERLAKRGVQVSEREISGIASWDYNRISRFAHSHGIPLQDLLELIDLVYMMFFSSNGVRWRKPLPSLAGATPGQRLCELRRLRKIRLNDFAQRARLGLENLCRYENDKRSLTSAELRTLIGIACVLDCPLVDVYREILGAAV